MKIAIGGISNEGCSFSPVLSDRNDYSWLIGDDLLQRYGFLSQYDDVEAIPLIRARAIPGGATTDDTYQYFKADFLSRLSEELPVQGIYLDMHGALFVDGMEDAEGDFLQAVRFLVGQDCIIVASYDLHGNLSQRVMEHVDIVTAYRTAPHIDEAETRERALSLLMRALRQGKPYQQYIRIPVMLPGEQTATTWEPGTSLYHQIPTVIDGEAVWDASILVGYAWADEPRTGASVVVIGTDNERVNEKARQLAQAYWDVRHEFRFGTTADTIENCLVPAMATSEKPVFISDAGDNITGGGVGDVTLMLERMLDLNVENALLASIVDRVAVQNCFEQAIGDSLQLELGGKLDTIHSKPLAVTAKILSHYTNLPDNRIVLIRVDNVTLIITERRTAFTRIEQFEYLGLKLTDFSIVTLKLGYLPPEFSALAVKEYLALSPGVIDQALDTLDYQHLQRPIFPLDTHMQWQPTE